jgi:hypothetical protein
MAANEEQRRRMLAMLLRIPPKNALQQAAPKPSNWLSKPLPMEGRFGLLPIKEEVPGMGPSLFNKRSAALPGLLAGAVNAFTAPGRAANGLLADPKGEALNFAGTFTGAGLLGSRLAPIPKGSVGMNAAPKSSTARLAAGDVVDGLTVGKEIKNTDSISASFNDWEEMGLQTVKMSDFDYTDPKKMFYDPRELKRTEELARQIKENGRIDPLIVVEDAKGRYVLEGGHRLGALHLLGKKEFPALIVRDLDP